VRRGARRAAALAAVALAAGSCARGPGPGALREAPLMRVGIVVDRPSGSFSGAGQFRVLTAGGDILAVVDAGVTWRAEPAEAGKVRLIRPDRDEPVVTASPVTVQTEDPNGLVVVEGQRYRGGLLVQRGSTGVTVVNRVPLEWYVQSVTAVELGFRAPSDRQAVMAQAVAARTYAVRYRGRREALGFDLYPTEADQVYPGVAAEKPEVTEAARQTAGQVLTYAGQPIEALFHSTCGHSTEAASEVFRNERGQPYLRAVSDRYGNGKDDYYCSISPQFRWREEWDAAALNATLAQTLPAVAGAAAAGIGRVTAVRVTQTTPMGRVKEMVVETTSGTFTVPGWRVRDVLRPAADRQLRSNQFQLHEERRGNDLVKLVAAGAGAGHGVGMCQWGAVGRSRAGQRYDRILAAYYPGTQLQRMF
jgi:stage II sporulation protein D